jgi:hypothetical protein
VGNLQFHQHSTLERDFSVVAFALPRPTCLALGKKEKIIRAGLTGVTGHHARLPNRS